jgi:hypothetical protein
VIDPAVRADVAGGGGVAVMAAQNERNQRVVEVGGGAQGVERALGQRAFGTGAGGRGRFAGQAGDEVHEQFRQFLIVDRPVHRQRPDTRFRRVVAAAGQHGVDRQMQRVADPHAADTGGCPCRRCSVRSG